MTLYEITECEHGYEGPQDRKHAQSLTPGGCWGGVRREVSVDYRAAAIEWMGADPPDNYPATRDDWEQMLDSVVEQSVKPMVDAALADYLTEEETE